MYLVDKERNSIPVPNAAPDGRWSDFEHSVLAFLDRTAEVGLENMLPAEVVRVSGASLLVFF